MAAIEPDPQRPPLTEEDLDRIRARLLANSNLGVDPTSPAFLDAVEGSIVGDLEGPTALELDEFYDFGNIVVAQTIPSTATGEHLDDWAESLGLERIDEAPAGGVLHFAGDVGADVPAGTQVTTEPAGDAEPIAFQVLVGGQIPAGGMLDLNAQAVNPGTAGNLPAGTVTVLGSDTPGVDSVTNPAPMTGGADVESDERLSGRVDDALAGDSGAGNQADYRRWLLSRPGVGFVTVRPAARGPGTVDNYVTDVNNDPLPAPSVAELQAWLDPVAGEGLGQAPIGHDAQVLTPGQFAVTVAATIEHEAGYSLDGANGTRATEDAIVAAVQRYVGARDVGETVVRDQVIRAVVGVPGVVKITDGTLTLNGNAANDLATPAGDVPFAQAVNLA